MNERLKAHILNTPLWVVTVVLLTIFVDEAQRKVSEGFGRPLNNSDYGLWHQYQKWEGVHWCSDAGGIDFRQLAEPGRRTSMPQFADILTHSHSAVVMAAQGGRWCLIQKKWTPYAPNL